MLPAIGMATIAGWTIGPIIIKVLLSLGIGMVTYTGFNQLLDYGLDTLVAQVNQLPTEQLALLGIMNIDKYITILFSAYSTKMLISGLTSAGTLTKFNMKGIPTG